MPGVTLKPKERRELEEVGRTTETASILRRVPALLGLDEGARAEEVGRRCSV